jgi:hypothetical protein
MLESYTANRTTRLVAVLLIGNALIALVLGLGLRDWESWGKFMVGLGVLEVLFGAVAAVPMTGPTAGASMHYRMPTLAVETDSALARRREFALGFCAVAVLAIAVGVVALAVV